MIETKFTFVSGDLTYLACPYSHKDESYNTDTSCDDCDHRNQFTGKCPYVAGDRTGRLICDEFIPITEKKKQSIMDDFFNRREI